MHGDGDAVGGSTKSSRCKYDLMDCMLCTRKDVVSSEEEGVEAEWESGMVKEKEKCI